MGCCASSLSPVERKAYQYILDHVPIHCQQEIVKLSARKFLSAYEKHLAAENHLQREEYLAAILSECQAIQDLEILLQHHEDHFIFADMYRLLSICYWKMGNIGLALLRGAIALFIRLKYTPTDYTEISLQCSRLVFIHLVRNEWKQAEELLVQAIITGRLSTTLPQGYIQELEEARVYLREKINERSRQRPIAHHFSSNPGESLDQCLRRLTTEMIPIYNEIGLLQIDKAEYERLPDKQTETQINDEILNEVLINLEKYLKEDSFLYKFGINGGSVSFIAAYFKGIQMKTSSLSSAMIEAALTIIINRINDEQYAVIKQLPFMISYTDEDESRMKGVRVFQVKKKEIIEVK